MQKRHFNGLIFALLVVVASTIVVLGEKNISMADEAGAKSLTAVTGSLVFNGMVNDPDFNLDKSYPLLWRKVEMAQYRRRQKHVALELSDKQSFSSVRGKTVLGLTKTYTNPPFPTWISTEFGDVRIKNDEQMYRLDKTLVEKLTYNGYVNFDQNPEKFVVARKLVQGGEEGWKNKNLIDYDPKKHNLKVGDVVVTWYAIRPESLAQTYTVVGYVHGDVIGDEKDARGDTRGDAFISDHDHESLRKRYNKGGGVKQDMKKAGEEDQKAAEQRDSKAQFNLGLRYYKGEGVPQDKQKAAECFQKAAEQGHAKAQNQIGFMYAKGEGVQQDMKKAVEWYQKAAEQGHILAQFNLAISYDDGDGVPQDKQKAVEWYRKAAEQGHATAQFNLAIMYKKGEGVGQDKKKAVEWYQKAAEQGFASAQYSLGIMYYNGEGVQQDKKKAVEWFQKAAEQGHAHAQFELGDMYEKGDGVEQNKATAKEWYGKACAKGLEKACKALKRIEQS